MRRAILIAVALFCSVTAKAENAIEDFYTGNQLYSLCQRHSDACVGYILGVAAARSGNWFCFPAGVDGQQVVEVTKRWLSNHAESRHLPANRLVVQALKEAFPCK